MAQIIPTMLQIVGQSLITLIGTIIYISKNQTQISAEMNRRFDILDLKFTHVVEKYEDLVARIASLEGFREDVYRSGILKERSLR